MIGIFKQTKRNLLIIENQKVNRRETKENRNGEKLTRFVREKQREGEKCEDPSCALPAASLRLRRGKEIRDVDERSRSFWV